MRYRLIIRPEAETDIQEAFDWYERHVPGLGAEFLAALDAAMSTILSHPFQHPVIYRNARRALTCRFPYQVFFVMADEIIVVIAVSHGARDPQRWQNRT